VGQVIQVPVNHNEGNWTAGADRLQEIEDQGLVLFRYCDADGTVTDAANPNGAGHNVAGVVNEGSNVLGMMPHPERVCEDILGGVDGRLIFASIIDHVLASRKAPASTGGAAAGAEAGTAPGGVASATAVRPQVLRLRWGRRRCLSFSSSWALLAGSTSASATSRGGNRPTSNWPSSPSCGASTVATSTPSLC